MKTKSTFAFTLVFVLFIVLPGKALHPKITWRTGHIELWDRTDLEGDLAYNWAAEMVSLRQPDGRIRTFSVNQVARFGWFDQSMNKLRNFVSFVKPLDKDRAHQAFYEICMDGPLAVVRRMKKPHGLFKHWFSNPNLANDEPVMAQDTEFFDYFVYDAGHLLALERFHTDIYIPLMTMYNRELHRYVQVHNINDRSLPGRLMIIDRYNWMVQQDTRAASAKESFRALD